MNHSVFWQNFFLARALTISLEIESAMMGRTLSSFARKNKPEWFLQLLQAVCRKVHSSRLLQQKVFSILPNRVIHFSIIMLLFASIAGFF